MRVYQGTYNSQTLVIQLVHRGPLKDAQIPTATLISRRFFIILLPIYYFFSNI